MEPPDASWIERIFPHFHFMVRVLPPTIPHRELANMQGEGRREMEEQKGGSDIMNSPPKAFKVRNIELDNSPELHSCGRIQIQAV